MVNSAVRMTNRMTTYTANSTMIKKYVTAKMGHLNIFPAMLCKRPGMTDNNPMTTRSPPKLRHKKTPIFQSIKGHSLENQAQNDDVVVLDGGCNMAKISVMLMSSDGLIVPSPLVSK
mmetsp:Transcript_84435/g.126581  ORF Transcript_84435/g.126581 Transcript_84435/m.126581 type:complete len:117 (-) Transcript_84435:753-1103(-)